MSLLSLVTGSYKLGDAPSGVVGYIYAVYAGGPAILLTDCFGEELVALGCVKVVYTHLQCNGSDAAVV